MQDAPKDTNLPQRRAVKNISKALLSGYQFFVTDTLTPLCIEKNKTALRTVCERDYKNRTLEGTLYLWGQTKRGTSHLFYGLTTTGIGTLLTAASIASMVAFVSMNLILSVADITYKFISMQFVVLSYCIAKAAGGILIDPFVLLYNLYHHDDEEKQVVVNVAPKKVRQWYTEQLRTILQAGELGFRAHQFAHLSATRHFGLIAAVVDLLFCECHIFVKTFAKAMRATARVGNTLQKFPGQGLYCTLLGLQLMTKGTIQYASIFLTLAKVPIKVAITEAKMIYHERERKETFEDRFTEGTNLMEKSLHTLMYGRVTQTA